MKKYSITATIFLISFFIVPSFVHAIWWNPSSWFNSDSSVVPPNEELMKKVQELEKRILDNESKTPAQTMEASVNVKEEATKKTPANNTDKTDLALQVKIDALMAEKTSLQAQISSLKAQLTSSQNEYAICKVNLTSKSEQTQSQTDEAKIAQNIRVKIAELTQLKTEINAITLSSERLAIEEEKINGFKTLEGSYFFGTPSSVFMASDGTVKVVSPSSFIDGLHTKTILVWKSSLITKIDLEITRLNTELQKHI